MTKNICGEADLIKKILVGLPVESLIRFKCVCKSWCDLIQTSSFIDLYFKSSSSSNKFGSFILHAAVDSEKFREDALFMVSPESESSECVSTRSWCSESFGLWSTPVCNGICGRCDVSGSGGWWWRTDDGFCSRCFKSHNYVEEKKDVQVSKMDSFLGGVSDDDDDDDDDNDNGDDKLSKIYNFFNDQVVLDNNKYVGGGGEGGGVSNDNDDDDEQQLVLKLENLGFPSCYNFGKNKPHMVMVVGSCNGLICLHDSERSDVSLWNPATRQFRILPKSITFNGDDCLHHRLFAFGFDAKTKDYKVVLLSGLRLRPRRIIDGVLSVGPMECFCRIQVYSLSTDSWRLLEGINVLPGTPFHCPDSSSSGQGQLLYLNGSCFLLAKFLLYYSEEQPCIPPHKDNDRFIISLDLTKEIIIPIQLPDHDADEELYLSYLGKKIALFTKTISCMGDGCCWERSCMGNGCCWELFHIWVLNKHSSNNNNNMNKESWTNINWFPIKLGLPGEHNIPRGISNDGVFVLLETVIPGGLGNKKRMKLYNLATNMLELLKNSISWDQVLKNFISCDQVLSNAYPYKPSLVSIIGGGNGSSSSRVLWK